MSDLRVDNHGTIFVIAPLTPEGTNWCEAHLPPDAQTWGRAGIVVEHRYIGDIVFGAREDGLEVTT